MLQQYLCSNLQFLQIQRSDTNCFIKYKAVPNTMCYTISPMPRFTLLINAFTLQGTNQKDVRPIRNAEYTLKYVKKSIACFQKWRRDIQYKPSTFYQLHKTINQHKLHEMFPFTCILRLIFSSSNKMCTRFLQILLYTVQHRLIVMSQVPMCRNYPNKVYVHFTNWLNANL